MLGGKEDGALRAKINLRAGGIFNLKNKIGIHFCAGFCQALQARRQISAPRREHSGGSVGGLAPRFRFFKNQDPQATSSELQRQGKPNNARTQNDDIGRFHSAILWERRAQL